MLPLAACLAVEGLELLSYPSSLTHPEPSGQAPPSEFDEVFNDRYRIVRRLGRGGMSTVYLALDMQHADRPVSLKRVRRDHMDGRALESLRNEFLAVAAVPHPGVARAHDFGADAATGDHFFTYEYVSGVHWLEAMKSLDIATPDGFEAFLEVLAQMLRALEFIHFRGLIHGDIKPQNVLLTPLETGSGLCPLLQQRRYSVKIIDFGLARGELTLEDTKIFGTPYYIAPETILGSPADRRADLYSLGVVLYHLSTGQLPFRADSHLEVLKEHLEKPPAPPREIAPFLPRGLEAVILRLMEKKPEDRFSSAGDVIERLNSELGLRFPIETPETCASYLEVAMPVARERQMMHLRDVVAGVLAVDTAAHTEMPVPAHRMVVIRGEKGSGKRRLVDELRRVAQTWGVSFVTVDCARPSPLPSPGCGGLSTRSGILAMARQLLERSRECPVVLHFHDLHLAGQQVFEIVATLVALMSNGSIPGNRFTMTATAVEGGETENAMFQLFSRASIYRENVLEILLERLDVAEVARFLEATFSGLELPETFVQGIVEKGRGNLQAILDLVLLEVRDERIRRTAEGWIHEGG